MGEGVELGSQQVLEIRHRVGMGHDAKVVPVGLGDEEFNDRPGHPLTPDVLPDFDVVGLLRLTPLHGLAAHLLQRCDAGVGENDAAHVSGSQR